MNGSRNRRTSWRRRPEWVAMITWRKGVLAWLREAKDICPLLHFQNVEWWIKERVAFQCQNRAWFTGKRSEEKQLLYNPKTFPRKRTDEGAELRAEELWLVEHALQPSLDDGVSNWLQTTLTLALKSLTVDTCKTAFFYFVCFVSLGVSLS